MFFQSAMRAYPFALDAALRYLLIDKNTQTIPYLIERLNYPKTDVYFCPPLKTG